MVLVNVFEKKSGIFVPAAVQGNGRTCIYNKLSISRKTTYLDLKEEPGRFVAVSKNLVGLVIGKGSTIKQIEMQSGAKLTTSEVKHAPGFMVHGSEENVHTQQNL